MFPAPKHLAIILAPLLLAACVSIQDRLDISSTRAGDVPGAACSEMAAETLSRNVPAEGLDPSHISLLNWNIYKGDAEGWQDDLSAMARNHDVLTIQEALLDSELRALLSANRFNWTMNTAFYLGDDAAGVMTAAHFSATRYCGFKIPEPLIRIPKAALVSYYPLNGRDQQLLVANIHGINFTLGLDAYREQLDRLYEAVRQHEGPMIIAGDFNSWSDARMAEVNRLVQRLSLSSLSYAVNNKTHLFGNAIDHVFYRQLEPLEQRVWQVSSSDHNPISVTFRYDAPAAASPALAVDFTAP